MAAIWKLALTLLACYAVIVAGCTVFQRSLMYFPATGLPSPAEAGAADMSVVRYSTDDGLTLVAWYVPAREGRATILYFHGNAGSIAHRVDKTRPLVAAGHGLLLVEYRGYGGNPGSPTEDGLYADAEAAYRFLVDEQGVSPARIAVLGESLGTGVAVWLAQQKPVGAVLLEAPYTSVADVAQRTYFFLPAKLLVHDRFASIERIAAIDAPLLIVHGLRDTVIGVDFGRSLFAAAVEPKEGHFLPGAGHNDMPAFGLLDLELRFLERYLSGG